MAAACFYAGAKAEEQPKKLRDVLPLVHHLKSEQLRQPIEPLDPNSKVGGAADQTANQPGKPIHMCFTFRGEARLLTGTLDLSSPPNRTTRN